MVCSYVSSSATIVEEVIILVSMLNLWSSNIASSNSNFLGFTWLTFQTHCGFNTHDLHQPVCTECGHTHKILLVLLNWSILWPNLLVYYVWSKSTCLWSYFLYSINFWTECGHTHKILLVLLNWSILCPNLLVYYVWSKSTCLCSYFLYSINFYWIKVGSL